MNEVTRLTLENEMDLIVAHKRMVNVGEYLKLTLTTQITLATAIVEASREVIDKTDTGYLVIFLTQENRKCFLSGKIYFTGDLPLSANDPGMAYARKLVPEFIFFKDETGGSIEMQIGIPRSIKLTGEMIDTMQTYFKNLKPATPYEELKARNNALNQLTIEQKEQLKYSKYLEEKKNEFISTASHELKTPLTSIIAFSQMALTASADECSPKIHDLIKRIYTQSGKLNLLIQQLLDVSKMESGHMEYNKEQLNLSDYLPELLETLKTIHSQHTITLTLNNDNNWVYADKLRLEQAFTNLIGNAAKYSKPGSTIQIYIDSNKEGMERIAITDEGIGMSKESADLIFNKFYREEQVTNLYAGLGIGLYITKNIIEEHGGTIRAKSIPGKGSTFTFTLPAINLAGN